jgi:hypothetical protein
MTCRRSSLRHRQVGTRILVLLRREHLDSPDQGEEVKKLMTSYLKQPPPKLQSAVYTGPITITDCQKFQWLREQAQDVGARTFFWRWG